MTMRIDNNDNGGMKCKRMMLLESGRVAGVFVNTMMNGGKLIVVIEPSGACLSYSHGDGVVQREITRFSRGIVRPAAMQLIKFRNKHGMNEPYVHGALHEHDVELDYQLGVVRWPTNGGVVELDNGQRRLCSLEGAATLTAAKNKENFLIETLVENLNN